MKHDGPGGFGRALLAAAGLTAFVVLCTLNSGRLPLRRV